MKTNLTEETILYMDAFFRGYLDQVIDRHGTGSVKWDDALKSHFGRADLEAAWVADMDFRTVPEVCRALTERAQSGIYGYTDTDRDDRRAAQGWLKRRHGLDVPAEWIEYSPGVVDSIFFCVRALTRPGDGIMFQTPAYMPFYHVVELFGCKLVANPLMETEEGWRIDFDDMEEKLSKGLVKLMIFCNPHNPVGRVWTRDELTRTVELCDRYGVRLISDEIHADFAFDGRKTTRILSVPGTEKAVMLMSATKSFNLAGLRHSSWITPDDETRRLIREEIVRAHQTSPNLFGALAQTTAYDHGDKWMDAVLEYIRENRDYVFTRLGQVRGLRAAKQEGTYLMWIDFRGTGLEHDAIRDRLINGAGVALNDGVDFGAEGAGFFRMNLAAPRTTIARITEKIARAFEEV